MPPSSGPAKLKIRRQVAEKIREIKSYIDEQRGNNLGDTVGWKVAQKVLDDINLIRYQPWLAPRMEGLDENYRKGRVGKNYTIYYYVVDPARLIYVIELRHSKQKPLQPGTLVKYKNETQNQ